MNSVINAWRAASLRQKVVIGAALVFVAGGVSVLLSPPPVEPGTAQANPTPTLAVVSVPTGSPSAQDSASPTLAPTPTAAATPTAHATATSKPAPVPTPRPTAAQTPPPTLTLTFTSLTSPVSRGSYATATVKTRAGAACSIVVEYKSGPSTAAGLGPKTANSNGVASWTWKVGTRTTLGSWPVTVTCASGGVRKSVTKYLQVVA